ncbi:hypothetical protein ACLB2K_065795 [Fragaria x ananassa]
MHDSLLILFHKYRIDENDSAAMMRAAEEVLEAQRKQKSLFELFGKLAVETSRFRGDGPKKKLILSNANVYRVFCFNKGGIPRDRASDGRCGNHLVHKRPFSEEFMLFCLESFEVGIWTSALEKNVDGVLDCVIGKAEKQTHICVGSASMY